MKIKVTGVFTRPNLEVAWWSYSSQTGAVVSALIKSNDLEVWAVESKDGLTLNTVMLYHTQAAFDTFINDPTVMAERTARDEYYQSKGVTVNITKETIE